MSEVEVEGRGQWQWSELEVEVKSSGSHLRFSVFVRSEREWMTEVEVGGRGRR